MSDRKKTLLPSATWVKVLFAILLLAGVVIVSIAVVSKLVSKRREKLAAQTEKLAAQTAVKEFFEDGGGWLHAAMPPHELKLAPIKEYRILGAREYGMQEVGEVFEYRFDVQVTHLVPNAVVKEAIKQTLGGKATFRPEDAGEQTSQLVPVVVYYEVTVTKTALLGGGGIYERWYIKSVKAVRRERELDRRP